VPALLCFALSKNRKSWTTKETPKTRVLEALTAAGTAPLRKSFKPQLYEGSVAVESASNASCGPRPGRNP
jgi:hypothetical protein